jgi:PPM family protein phosphatase
MGMEGSTVSGLGLRYDLFTDRGPVRARNEDAAYADPRTLAVADGMGGHPAGDLAASLAIRPFVSLSSSATLL